MKVAQVARFESFKVSCKQTTATTDNRQQTRGEDERHWQIAINDLFPVAAIEQRAQYQCRPAKQCEDRA